MFYTPEEKGLTPKQIDDICERLWKERLTESACCHDCGVKPNEVHLINCDVARCTVCGRQRLSCDCDDGDGDVWTGIWPGIKECYEQKLICFDDNTFFKIKPHWRFDLNRLAEINNVSDKDFL